MHTRSLARDTAIAALAVAVVLLGLQVARAAGWSAVDTRSAVATTVLSGAAWAGARHAPKTTLTVMAVVVAMPVWMFAGPGIRIIPLVVAGFVAALRGARPLVVVPVYAVGIVLGLTVDTTALMWRFRDWGVAVAVLLGDNVQKLLIAVVAGVVLALGYLVRRQRIASRTLRERNAQLAALRREEDARIVAETRTAIARDIHDVVAHHMTAVVVTAQSAAADPRRDLGALHSAMVTIAAEGQEALTAMRRAVRVLRTDAADEVADRTSDIDPFVQQMADRVRATGRAVSVEGTPSRVPQFAQLAMARIVQEALTNVMLHSDARAVTVAFTDVEQRLVLRIADDGSPARRPSASTGGHGVTGMKERARALGGTLTAGADREGGGWTVTMTLPLHSA